MTTELTTQKQTITAPKKGQRQHHNLPAPGLLNLTGLNKIQGQGNNMKIPHSQGTITLTDHTTQNENTNETTRPDPTPNTTTPLTTQKLQKENGLGYALIAPLHLTTALIAADTQNTGILINNQLYRFSLALTRNQNTGEWTPLTAYAIRDENGHITTNGNTIEQTINIATRAAELYYRARYQDYVLAEWVHINNTLHQFETLARRIKTKKINQKSAKAFYAFRFSGNTTALRAHEQSLIILLNSLK